MEKLLEYSIYIVFGLLLTYKMINDYISERLENTIKFVLYSLITIYLILAEIQANIIFIVLIGAILFVPSMINMGEKEYDDGDLLYAIEILFCTVNIFIILIKFGVMRLLFNI